MATRIREDRRLRQLSAVCLALPETERTSCGAHADFRVRGKIFAYFLRNHGDDGITAACFKSRLGQHVEHVKRAPDRFYLPRYLGRRGWFGLRLDHGGIDWEEVAALAAVSYDLVAPKELRGTHAAVGNALTASSLVKGAPSPMLIVNNALHPQPPAQERADAEARHDPAEGLRPAAASFTRSSGMRGRR